ncbi:SusD/RagB family nutrient-binding outer membrane lipoprotein [Agriterribacter sp.]|uniref:SusD/RagB family nutrient-binding outer membrane lipoprotein n=1 Tax=Agriterribacter sp. TaxID=2821509 RepID=UPI002CA1F68E|nr:SusD/RagB family nutrient-binding outer membrane lipoprotein [Agriterribacter sp.]HRO45475.1 SusD/RagB family nutrient-binding outer membrane lipoprotein [Agriterribacter sp.]HRQ18892.1 SusD/RagB family nutrient-binding outer membrane lipoprotein [Agriterribacter sp.]
MKKIYIISLTIVSMIAGLSCQKHLVELNENPNGADPSTTNPNLVLSTVLTESARALVNLGYLDIAGVMQHTQKDGWAGGHNNYDWGNSNDWGGYYGILRNNQFVYDKAVELNYPLHQGITLVMKSLIFGLITDLWGDAPYSDALKGNLGGAENTFPIFDAQQSIYDSILLNLEKANTLLDEASFNSSTGPADIYYTGDALKWRKFANSLALRYYMRLSEKLPSVAQQGIEKIAGDPTKYPVITAVADEPSMAFPGNSDADSWPAYAVPQSDSTNYIRIKMCNTLVKELLSKNDPRIRAWAEPVTESIYVDADLTGNISKVVFDTTINGVHRPRVMIITNEFIAAKGITINDINQDPYYVGLPVALNAPQTYNLSPDVQQASHNTHVSWVNKKFAQGNAGGVRVRLITAAEVHFILAEAAAKGWNAGDAETHYNQGIAASFSVWGFGADAPAYIAQPEVAYDGTIEQIITQKWIASWSMAAEAWFDWRRTGYPELHGVAGFTQAPELPLRFYYPLGERNLNGANVEVANNKLETTPYSNFGGNGAKNSPWSRPWIVQGTGKPW